MALLQGSALTFWAEVTPEAFGGTGEKHAKNKIGHNRFTHAVLHLTIFDPGQV